MAETKYMHPPSASLEREGSKEKAGNVGRIEKLQDYMGLIRNCMDAEHKMSASCKFNRKQCEYLADKFEVLVESAKSFLEMVQSEYVHGSYLPGVLDQGVEVFKFMFTVARQIQDFIQSCCAVKWVKVAMTMINISDYVSSLGFDVELCRLACGGLLKECGGSGSITSVELQDNISNAEVVIAKSMTSLDLVTLSGQVDKTWIDIDIRYSTEVEIVEVLAIVDLGTLHDDVTAKLTSSDGKEKDLAGHLLQRLALQSHPTKEKWNWLKSSWFKLMIPIVKQLGRGATATVYEAKWLGMRVAEKVFEGQHNEEFEVEASNIARLHHHNITSMFCCKKTENDSSIIMELMDEDLHTLLHNNCDNPFPIFEAVDIILQVGEGVNYLHNNEMVHRDLKPKNILVKTKEMEVGYIHAKVTDFGLSITKNCSLRQSELPQNVGTNRYMAPELMNLSSEKSSSKASYPFKCDTYSYGMLCYEVLTGKIPFYEFKKEDDKNLKSKVKEGLRPVLHERLPAMLKALIEKCWSEDPKERPRFDFICSQLRYLKYLLIIGANEETHKRAATEFEAAANDARRKEEAREEEVLAKHWQDIVASQAKQANDALPQKVRDAQARERELELKNAAAKMAFKYMTAIKRREIASLVAHRQGLPPFEYPTIQQRQIAREQIQYEVGKFHIAICGASGSGRSTLINAFRGLSGRDKGAAGVGVSETTLEVTRYPDLRNGFPYERLVWYDIPGAGTAAVSNKQYFQSEGLFAFDCIILVYSDRFTNIDMDIMENSIRCGIPIIVVRSKADQHIDNMIKAETDSSTDDDDEDQSCQDKKFQIYQEVKAKYINITKSAFDMHKEVMVDVLFNDDSWERYKLRKQHVYVVSASNVRSLMRAKVKDGRGVTESKLLDEALLIEETLRTPLTYNVFPLFPRDHRDIPYWQTEDEHAVYAKDLGEPAFEVNELQKVQLKVQMCCAKCEEIIVEEIREVRGVFDVRTERSEKKVVVMITPGGVDEHEVLRKARKVDRKARFVELDAKEKQKPKGDKNPKDHGHGSDDDHGNKSGQGKQQ